jgi:2-amino-4-hydroxy-6-hydroxymethyldihydropteridine diphosphokinase
MAQGYLLGIGTNVDPERNAVRIVERLAHRFGRIVLSRFYATDPVGMASDRRFVNFCAFVATDLAPAPMKAACVAIELELGRDRAHPESKTRDRPADIDLQIRLAADGGRQELEPVPPYLAVPAAEILALLTPGQAAPPAGAGICAVVASALRLGETPAAVDRDDRTGLVVVG